MPKLQKTEERDKFELLNSTIEKYMKYRDIPRHKLAERIGIPYQTLSGKLRDPARLTWENLYAICKVLKIPPDEAAACLPGKPRDVTVRVVVTDLGGKELGVYG